MSEEAGSLTTSEVLPEAKLPNKQPNCGQPHFFVTFDSHMWNMSVHLKKEKWVNLNFTYETLDAQIRIYLHLGKPWCYSLRIKPSETEADQYIISRHDFISIGKHVLEGVLPPANQQPIRDYINEIAHSMPTELSLWSSFRDPKLNEIFAGCFPYEVVIDVKLPYEVGLLANQRGDSGAWICKWEICNHIEQSVWTRNLELRAARVASSQFEKEDGAICLQLTYDGGSILSNVRGCKALLEELRPSISHAVQEKNIQRSCKSSYSIETDQLKYFVKLSKGNRFQFSSQYLAQTLVKLVDGQQWTHANTDVRSRTRYNASA